MRKVVAWGLRRPRALTMMFSLFWRRPPKKNEKRAILREQGAYCELASSLSSLDTASEREPAGDGDITQLTNSIHRLSFFLCACNSKGLVPCLFSCAGSSLTGQALALRNGRRHSLLRRHLAVRVLSALRPHFPSRVSFMRSFFASCCVLVRRPAACAVYVADRPRGVTPDAAPERR